MKYTNILLLLLALNMSLEQSNSQLCSKSQCVAIFSTNACCNSEGNCQTSKVECKKNCGNCKYCCVDGQCQSQSYCLEHQYSDNLEAFDSSLIKSESSANMDTGIVIMIIFGSIVVIIFIVFGILGWKHRNDPYYGQQYPGQYYGENQYPDYYNQYPNEYHHHNKYHNQFPNQYPAPYPNQFPNQQYPNQFNGYYNSQMGNTLNNNLPN